MLAHTQQSDTALHADATESRGHCTFMDTEMESASHHYGVDSQETVHVAVDDDGRTVGLELASDWTQIVSEDELGAHVVEAYGSAIAARDTTQLEQVDLAGLTARLRSLASMSPEQVRAHMGDARDDAPWRGRNTSDNEDLIDPERRAAHAELIREIYSQPDEVTSSDGLLSVSSLAGRPTGVRAARGWSNRYDVQRQAVQLFELLDELAERHEARQARIEIEFPGLGARQQKAIDRGLDLVRSIPLPDDDDGRRRTDG